MVNSKFYLLALALGTLAACGNDNEMDNATINSDLVPLEVTGSINGLKTRVTADNQWESGDRIGISGTSGELTYSNYCYKYKGGTEFEPGTANIIYFGDATGTFSAYYPYQNDSRYIKDGKITWSVGSYTNNMDFLFAKNVVSKEDPNLALKFDHKMCLLILHMKGGTGFSDLSFDNGFHNDKINFAPVRSQVIFDTTNGTATPTGDALKQFAPESYKESIGDGYYYRVILCPETIKGGITFTLDKKTYGENVTYTALLTTNDDKANPVMNMEPGKVYEYTMTVSKTEMIPGNVTINDWTPAWDGSKDVEATV